MRTHGRGQWSAWPGLVLIAALSAGAVPGASASPAAPGASGPALAAPGPASTTSQDPAPPMQPALLSGLVWRNIGPLRAGRVASVTGAVGEPGVFYAGLPAGGIWKTDNAGITWNPIFDAVTTVSSVGAIEVAPSDTSVIYAGTGDMVTGGAINEGEGIYKSADAGRTWRHMGLDSTKQIPSILVDPKNPDLVLVAAQGNIHVKSGARGVFRSTDGGQSWTRTLFVDDSTGAQKLAWAYDRPDVVFATTVRHYSEPGASRFRRYYFGAPSGTHLFKSIDEGLTWHEISGGGLPELSGRTSLAVAMHTDARRVFLIGNFGLYRSDDGGATWRQMDASDSRIRNGQGGYNCGVYVSSEDPDLVYTINTSSYVSTDGGNTFTGFKGAPGGDDPQQMWIDPTDGSRIFLGMDQGATVSLDGGRTWSPWYNQSTEQVYHLSTDNSYPFWVYAPQQDAGAIRVRSRGNFGEITPLDWDPVGGWEWGTIMADPLNPKLVYASGSGIIKITYPSEQTINVSPSQDPDAHLRSTSTNPLVWAPWDQHELLAGFQYLMATTDGGAHWRKLSPDLGLPQGVKPAAPGSATGRFGGRGEGAIESISPSTVTRGVIWVGTNNGLIKLTRDDGKSWQDVSIPGLPDSSESDISTIDASHQDAAEAYVAVDAHGTGDYTPYFYRSRDYGRTWTKIVDGLPTDEASGSFARVIRADTKKAGLLFAGTESSMYVSFDDGDHWQSLRLNLPTTSFRDATIKGNDLVVGTYGRGIWILDDISPLRQLTPAIAGETVHLFKPGDALRVRRNVNQDTPFPPEVPHSINPPPGALIYYYLGAPAQGEVSLDVLDATGRVVRHMSSAPFQPVAEAADPPEPNFWLAAPRPLPTSAGLHRVDWNIRYDDPPAFRHSFEINANPELTPASPQGPLALPGVYSIRLTVNGHSYTQSLTVRNDPRSPATLAELEAQHALQMKIYAGIREAWQGHQQAVAMKTAIQHTIGTDATPALATAAKSFDARVDSVAGVTEGGRGFFGFRGRGGPPPPDFVQVNGALVRQLETQDTGDMAPNAPMLAAFTDECTRLDTVMTAWRQLNGADLARFNAALRRQGLQPVSSAPPLPAAPPCATSQPPGSVPR
jgi:photosystem II stability/assembly factor-like uncharacterized protein